MSIVLDDSDGAGAVADPPAGLASVRQRLLLQSAALEAAANAIFITRADGRIIWANPAFTALTGYTAEEIIGQTPAAIRSGKQGDAFYRAMWNAVLAGNVWHGEIINRRKDGSLYTVEQTITPVRSQRGDVTHLVSINHDITARKQAAEAQARLIAVLEATPDLVGTASVDGKLRYVNQAGRRLLGLPDGARIEDFGIADFHPEWARKLLLEEAIPTAVVRGVWSGETALTTYDGREIATSQVVIGHRGPDGTMEYLSTIMRDITERKRAADTLRQTEKVAAMGQLLAGVAHELNNPLAVVLAYCQLIMNDADGRLAGRARKVLEAAERCARIVKNFLALARQYPPERQEVAINDVVRQALELLAYPLKIDNMEVRLDFAPDVPFLLADAHQLHQVFVNLITNAHQAMREIAGPRRLTITTTFEPAAGCVVAAVTDTGPGITPEVRARLFEPFFTTKPPGQGTGLGLSLCQSVVESHGGTIGVESTPGAGATFVVRLPVQAASGAHAAPPLAAPPAISTMSVLVVEDEPEVAAVLKETLEIAGHRVDTAANGAAAFQRIHDGRYDVVFSDLKMPAVDGPALYARLEALGHPLTRRFVFVTGDVLGEETRAFLERVQAVCINKPFALDDVHRALAQVLKKP